MNIETLNLNLIGRGVSESQIQLLDAHLAVSQNFIYPQDPGQTSSLAWINGSIGNVMDKRESDLIRKIITVNLPSPEVEYCESGYDSCQSHRKLSKVVAEAILLGGLIYEGQLLGLTVNLSDALQIIGSELKVDHRIGSKLAKIAQVYGGKQDFIFPGVTPTDHTTPSLSELSLQVFKGAPQTTVRTLTGVGGLRSDKDWNYVTDLVTFADLKVKEDKRYYPGLGIFHFLASQDLDSIPALVTAKTKSPDFYQHLVALAAKIKSSPSQQFEGVSILCSAYLPYWSELKAFQGFAESSGIELSQSFHSPSYEFVTLKNVFERINQGKAIDKLTLGQIDDLRTKVGHCWSFNSTIHLPWTAELADLSSGLIGRITNQAGDYAVRYGVGYKGRSLEVREYAYGLDRKFPYGLANKRAYSLIYYPNSDKFEGEAETQFLTKSDRLFNSLAEKGFMKVALNYLS